MEPNTPAALRARLEQASNRRLTDEELPIPPYPSVALCVQQALSRPGTGTADLARLVGSDGALAARVLRCANSALYGRGEPVTSLTQAIGRIGVQQLMRVLLASGLASHAQAPGPFAPARRLIWIEGLAAALVCQELARLRQLPAEEAFVLGLLHDFGRIVAVAYLESQVGGGDLAGTWSPGEVVEAIDPYHVPLGMTLARRWKLPAVVGEVVEGHHGPPGASRQDTGLLAVVKASDQVVAVLTSETTVSECLLAAKAPLVDRDEREAVARIVEKIPEFVAALDPTGGSSATSAHRDARRGPSRPVEEGPVTVRVTVTVGRRPHEFGSAEITPGRLVVLGDTALPENRLLEATVHSHPDPFGMWALTNPLGSVGDVHRSELQPFALDARTQKFWERLVADAQRASGTPGGSEKATDPDPRPRAPSTPGGTPGP